MTSFSLSETKFQLLLYFDLYELEKTFKINIITQNIDNLHEIAGSSSIIYIHGELNKARCIKNDTHIHYWKNDLDEKLKSKPLAKI